MNICARQILFGRVGIPVTIKDRTGVSKKRRKNIIFKNEFMWTKCATQMRTTGEHRLS
jgi:hypothetical protein